MRSRLPYFGFKHQRVLEHTIQVEQLGAVQVRKAWCDVTAGAQAECTSRWEILEAEKRRFAVTLAFER